MSLWGREHGEVAVGMSTRWPAEGICLGLLFSLDRSGFHCSYKLVPYAFDSLLTLPVMADLTYNWEMVGMRLPLFRSDIGIAKDICPSSLPEHLLQREGIKVTGFYLSPEGKALARAQAPGCRRWRRKGEW